MNLALGLRLLAPFVAIVAAPILLTVGLIYWFRDTLRSALAAVDYEGDPWSGASRLLLVFALATVWWLASIEVLSATGLFVGLPVGVWCVAAGAVSMLAFVWFSVSAITGGRPLLNLGVILLALSLSAVALTAASGYFFDVSWDGNTAHQVAVVELARGWNPVQEPHVDVARVAQWAALEHFPKGAWIRGAALYRLTGTLEQSKVSGLLLLLAAFSAWTALLVSVARERRRAAVVFALAMAANPVALAQAFTFMVDGQLASLFSLCLAFAGLLYTRYARWPVTAGLAASLLMLSTVKFTGLVYVVAVVLALAVAATVVRPTQRRPAIAMWVVGAMLAAVCLVGYNPYTVNLLQGRSIFYPLVGAGAGDIMSNNVPGDFLGANRFERLFRSIFSEAAHQKGSSARAVTTRLKVPFTVRASEIRPYLAPETRIAGFGPLFGGILLLALVGVVLLLVRRATRRDRVVHGILFAAALVVSTVLVNPEGWWARYAPQMWLVPVLVAVALALRADVSWVRLLGLTMCGLLLANTAFVGALGFANTVNAKAEIGQALDRIATFTLPVRLQQRQFETTGAKLDARGISYLIVSDEPTLTGGVTIPYTTAIVAPGR